VSFTPTDIEDMTPRQLRTQINPKICLTVRVGKGFVGAGMPILVEDVSFRGYIRLKLKLTSNFPHIKTLDFCFLEPPVIDYTLKPVGGDTFGMDIAHVRTTRERVAGITITNINRIPLTTIDPWFAIIYS